MKNKIRGTPNASDQVGLLGYLIIAYSKLLKLCWCKLGVTAAIGIEVWLSVQLKNPISAVGWICFGVNSHCSLPSSESVPTELAGAFPRQ